MGRTEFRRPTPHGPAGADIFVAIGGVQTPSEVAWAWLIQPELWPRYYGQEYFNDLDAWDEFWSQCGRVEPGPGPVSAGPAIGRPDRSSCPLSGAR